MPRPPGVARGLPLLQGVWVVGLLCVPSSLEKEGAVVWLVSVALSVSAGGRP